MHSIILLLTTASVEEGRPEFPGSLHDQEDVDWSSTDDDGKGNQRGPRVRGQRQGNEEHGNHNHYDWEDPPHLHVDNEQ